jgi:hypothetical protein
MNKLITICFIFLSYLLSAQITGNVNNETNQAVEFATIYNLSQKTSAITNEGGFFKLEGKSGDSLRIQHVDCKTKDFIVVKLHDNYMLERKFTSLGEVEVTAQYVRGLLNKSCQNTFDKFHKQKTVSRGYFSYRSTNNCDTTQVIDLDVDVVYKKKKNLDKGQSIIPFTMQSRNLCDSSTLFVRIKPLYFTINEVSSWANFFENFRYYKVEDTSLIKLYFVGCETEGITEVTISKMDTCLVSFIINSGKSKLTSTEGNKIHIGQSTHYIKYDYTNGYCVIAESGIKYTLHHPHHKDEVLSMSLLFKSYNNSPNLERRETSDGIWFNKFEPKDFKTNYTTEFWNSKEYPSDIRSHTAFTIPDFNLKKNENENIQLPKSPLLSTIYFRFKKSD